MTATFYVGDVLDVLGKLPENSVDLVLSSPPFLALRSYLPADHPDKDKEGGSQSTPGEYIDWLLDVVEACDRVLAPHGSLCFELGDTYAGSGGAGGDYAEDGLRAGQPAFKANRGGRITTSADLAGKGENIGGHHLGGRGWPLPKSLSLIPESFRFAMVYGQNPFTGRQTERWRLRNVIRWVRPNPPVGALGDKFRPATSELMVFCKSAKRYFDLDSVRGEVSEWTKGYAERPVPISANDSASNTQSMGSGTRTSGLAHEAKPHNQQGAPPLDWWKISLLEGEEPKPYGPKPVYDPEARRQRPPQARTPRWDRAGDGVGGTGRKREAFSNEGNPAGAPPLDWWNIPPGGYEGAHYAVWPPELLIKPIKAMCPEQVCRTCGEARRRIVEASRANVPDDGTRRKASGNTNGWEPPPELGWQYDRTTTGWTDCGHNDWRPGLVLDCFGGSGTTGAVASGHGRDSILIDLDERNFALALARVGPLVLQRGEVAA